MIGSIDTFPRTYGVPYVKARLQNEQSVNNTTWTTLQYYTNISDVWQLHLADSTAARQRFYVPIPGLYRLDSVTAFFTNNAGYRYTRYLKNGTALQSITSQPFVTDNITWLWGSHIAPAVYGDYFECQAYVTGGTASVRDAYSDGSTWISLTYLRPQE